MNDKQLISSPPKRKLDFLMGLFSVIFMTVVMFMSSGEFWVSFLLSLGVSGVLVALSIWMPSKADEVYDCGDFLLVRHKGQERKIPFAQIVFGEYVQRYKLPNFIWLKMKDGTKIHFGAKDHLDSSELVRRILNKAAWNRGQGR